MEFYVGLWLGIFIGFVVATLLWIFMHHVLRSLP